MPKHSLKEMLSWSQERAIKEQLSWSEDPENQNNNERMPIQRWQDAQALKELKIIYADSKNPKAITEGLYYCMMNDFEVPRWLKMAYIHAFRKAKLHYEAKSWDEVFGLPHPKGTHLASKRQRREKKFAVYNEIRKIKAFNPKTPIDGYLFEKVGKKLGIGGKTLAEEYYYEVKKYKD
jgi:hypothetical protein